MKSKATPILKKIGYIASFFPFAALSLFGVYLLYGSNQYFFIDLELSRQILSEDALELTVSIFFYAIVVLMAAGAILSIWQRKKPAVNKGIIWGCGAVCLICAITFMILVHLVDLFLIAFENANLYLMYFVIGLFVISFPLYSSIRNLIKIKRSPVTFAKSDEQIKVQQ